MSKTALINVRQLYRTYGSGGDLRIALDHIDLSVDEGQVVGLLGPNGAGKTTLVKILTTLLYPSGGSAYINGFDVVLETKQAQRLVGVSFGGDQGLYSRLSGRDNLRFFASMYGLIGSKAASRIDELLSQVNLVDRQHDRVETYSRGMRQRLHIARALVHNPPAIILDEPSSGLDPESARDLRRLIGDLAAEGKAVLLTTHDLGEAEQLCSRVAILHKGSIVLEGAPDVLRAAAAEEVGSVIDVGNPIAKVTMLVDQLSGILWLEETSAGSRIYSLEPGLVVDALAQGLGRELVSLTVTPPTLEDVYFRQFGLSR